MKIRLGIVGVLSFGLLLGNVSAKTVVENASVCEVNEIYRDASSIENAIGDKDYLDDLLGHKTYCPVYCVEEDIFTFPGYRPVANSGGNFTWTIGKDIDENILLGYTVNLKGRRNCRTKVNLDKWIKDYNKILERIEQLISELKKPIQTETLCPPKLGSRGCGYRIDTDFGNFDAGGPTSFINAGGLGNYISDSPNGGSKIRINEHFGLLDSNRFMNVYQYVPGTLWDETGSVESDLGITIKGWSYWFENQIKYQTWCPCEWRNESSASEPEVGADISLGSVDDSQNFDKACNWDSEQLINSAANSYIGRESKTVPNTNVTYTNSTTVLQCSNAHGGSVSSCNDSIWGVHERQTEEQAVRTRVGCSLSADISLSYERKTRNVNSGTDYYCISTGTTYNTSKKCTDECGTGMCITKTRWKQETYYEITDARIRNGSIKRNITSIEQEKCVGISGVSEVKTDCITGPSCPAGYHIGSDEMCNKTNTSELRTWQSKQKYMLDILENCSKWDINYYDLDTDAYIDYEEPVYGRIDKMTRETLSENSKENHKVMAKDDINLSSYIRNWSNSGASIPFYVCNLGASSRKCERHTQNYSKYWISEYGKEYEKEYGYYLPEKFYNFVLLPQGKSVDILPPNSTYIKYNRFIDIGHANYPIHYSTPSREPNYHLNVIFDKVGLYSKFSNDVYNNRYTEINNQQVEVIDYNGQKLLYQCEYNVKEGSPYCPSKGCKEDEYDLGSVRIVYRPISLEYPFPAMSGNGRDTGSNWCIINSDKTTDCKNTNENVQKYILNNRNTSGNNVYKKEPMYTITLNPSLIKEIRKYNAQTNYDDFYLYCNGLDGKEGTECKSKFLRGESISVDNMPGDMEAIANNISKHVSGCGISEWNECDKLDNYER